MRPEIALLVLLPVSCLFFRPAASHCVSRTSSYAVPVNYSSHSSASSVTRSSALPPKSSPPYSAPPPPYKSPPPASSPPPSTAPPPQSAGPKASPSLGLIDGAVKTVCGHTDYPDLCVSSIKSLSPSSGSLDAAALLKLEMQVIRTRLAPARAAAAKLLAGAKDDEAMKSIMESCLSQYDDVPYALDNALKALEAHDKGTLNSMLSAVLTDFDTCEQGFEDFETESLMASYDEPLSQLSSNCLAIATLV